MLNATCSQSYLVFRRNAGQSVDFNRLGYRQASLQAQKKAAPFNGAAF
jgi:hypothetical protein